MPAPPAPLWSPDLATADGRAALARRVARSPAVALPAPREGLRDGGPRLCVEVRGSSVGVVVALDHVLWPDPGPGRVLRRRLAVVGFEDPRDPGLEQAVLTWGLLARAHAELEARREAGLDRARDLARALRPRS